MRVKYVEMAIAVPFILLILAVWIVPSRAMTTINSSQRSPMRSAKPQAASCH
jgi:hypothetical protein